MTALNTSSSIPPLFDLQRVKRIRAAGNQARDRRDWTAAAEQYKLYLEKKPNDFAIWVQLGHSLKESGKPVEALVAYSHALALDDNDADLLLNLGHLYRLMGHRDLAIEYYRRSAAIDRNENAKFELRALGDLKKDGAENLHKAEAKNLAETSSQVRSTNAAQLDGNKSEPQLPPAPARKPLKFTLARVEKQNIVPTSTKSEEALEAIQSELSATTLLLNKANDYIVQLSDNLEKEVSFREEYTSYTTKIIYNNTNDLELLSYEISFLKEEIFNIKSSFVFYIFELLEKSKNRLRLAMRSQRKARDLIQEGNVARNAKNYNLAAVKYARALVFSPSRVDIRVQYANMLKDAGEFIEAEAQYRRALSQRPDDGDIYLQLGHLFHKQNRSNAALAAYERAAALQDDRARAIVAGHDK